MILLRGGRVVDPASGRDAVGDVLIDGGRVSAVADRLPEVPGARVVDVTGLVVGPGFVDLHSHVHTVAGQRLQAFDGVTTALDLEAGLMPVERAYSEAAAQGRPLHFGFSASWGSARAAVLVGRKPDATLASGLAVLDEPGWQRSSSASELTRWLGLLEGELAAGALGIGVLVGYAPRTDPEEYLAVARLAAAAGAPTFTHIREIVESDPTTPVDGVEEIVRAAAETGAAMHHCHVNSTSRRHVDRALDLLARSRAAGSRVTVEAYPYGAGATGVGAYFLAPERLSAWGLRPRDLVMVGTGERPADERRLTELRAADPGAECLVHVLDETDPDDRELLHRAQAFPDAIVASDAMPVVWPDGASDTRSWPLPADGSAHPRTAGTFAKTLRVFVCETGEWTWLEAFRRCSMLPARVLDEVAPDAQRKGFLDVGADADVVVFDPAVVTDRATYDDPLRPSGGVRHLLVGGSFVIEDGALRTESYPGRALRGAPR